jgi:hypothetical protein
LGYRRPRQDSTHRPYICAQLVAEGGNLDGAVAIVKDAEWIGGAMNDRYLSGELHLDDFLMRFRDVSRACRRQPDLSNGFVTG